MKYSFLTKGWHNNTFDEFCDVAKELKFKGIELHNIYNRLFTDKDGAFHDYTAAATVAMTATVFERTKLRIEMMISVNL